MHPSALDFGKLFFQTYCNSEKKLRVVDIGAQDVNGSLRSTCPETAEFIGVDFISGNGVDLVLDDPYKLPFDDGSIDVVTCSSCFEHSELFWVLFLEILRVLKPDGLLYLNTPSNGYIHKYPVDCWRLYPDAGRALVTWGKRNGYTPLLIESFIGEQREGAEGAWNDFVAIIKKSESSEEIPGQLMLDKVTGFQNGWRWDQAQPLNENFFSEDIKKIQHLDNLTINLHKQVSSKDDAIAALEHNNRDLNTTLTTKIQIIDDLNEIVATQNQQADNLNERMSSLENEIAAIRASRTWKILQKIARIKQIIFPR